MAKKRSFWAAVPLRWKVAGWFAAMLTVTALHITEEAESYQQLDLLGAQQTQRSEKQEKLEQAMDAIRGKYGKSAIAFGSNGGKQVGWDD